MHHNPVYLALDLPRVDAAEALARKVKAHVGGLKLGLEFFCAHGSHGVHEIAKVGLPIFLDLKLHDIPNTVAAAVQAIHVLQPSIITVHAAGGRAMMEDAKAAAGEHTRVPDLATFTAGVSTTGTTAAEALSANAAAMTRVIAALKGAAIEPRDIQTSSISLNPVFEQRPFNQADSSPPRIVGYQAGNSVSIRARQPGSFGKVIDTLVAAGATNINGPNFALDKPEAAQDEARRDAVAKARARADLYAAAAGLKVARILSITEGGQNDGPIARPFAPLMMARMDKAPTPVELGMQDVTAQVTIRFELSGQ